MSDKARQKQNERVLVRSLTRVFFLEFFFLLLKKRKKPLRSCSELLFVFGSSLPLAKAFPSSRILPSFPPFLPLRLPSFHSFSQATMREVISLHIGQAGTSKCFVERRRARARRNAKPKNASEGRCAQQRKNGKKRKTKRETLRLPLSL